MVEDEGLKREIGLWGLIANAVNIVIGAGIFILPVMAAETMGSGSLTAYVVCGVMMILIMLCFAQAGSRITVTGGAYSYIEQAFGSFAGFITANVFIFGASFTANAAVANGLADTLSYFLPVFGVKWVRILFFAVMFSVLGYYNVRGIKNAVFIVKFNTVAKLVPLIMIAILGWFFLEPADINFTVSKSIGDIGETSILLLFMFVGAETALNVSGEIRNPEKTIPRGIMISMVAVVLLFIMVQAVVQSILGEDISQYSDAPLAETGRRMLGRIGVIIVLAGTLFSMFGNISGMVFNMPRILYAAARDRVIPSDKLAAVHPVFKTPYIAVIVNSFLAFVVSSVGEFRLLALLSSASYMLIYLGVVLAVIKFNFRSGTGNTGILKGYIIPGISAIIIIWVLTNLPLNELTGMIIFIAILSLVYAAMVLFQKRNAGRSGRD